MCRDEHFRLSQTAPDAFAAGANEMVRVLVMDEPRGCIHPFGKNGDGIIAFIGAGRGSLASSHVMMAGSSR